MAKRLFKNLRVVSTNTAGNCCVMSEISGFVDISMAGNCPNVLFRILNCVATNIWKMVGCLETYSPKSIQWFHTYKCWNKRRLEQWSPARPSRPVWNIQIRTFNSGDSALNLRLCVMWWQDKVFLFISRKLSSFWRYINSLKLSWISWNVEQDVSLSSQPSCFTVCTDMVCVCVCVSIMNVFVESQCLCRRSADGLGSRLRLLHQDINTCVDPHSPAGVIIVSFTASGRALMTPPWLMSVIVAGGRSLIRINWLSQPKSPVGRSRWSRRRMEEVPPGAGWFESASKKHKKKRRNVQKS